MVSISGTIITRMVVTSIILGLGEACALRSPPQTPQPSISRPITVKFQIGDHETTYYSASEIINRNVSRVEFQCDVGTSGQEMCLVLFTTVSAVVTPYAKISRADRTITFNSTLLHVTKYEVSPCTDITTTTARSLAAEDYDSTSP